MQKHEPRARTLCYNCYHDNHNEHNKDKKLLGFLIKADHFGKCECPICNYCDCDWCKEQRRIYSIGEGN